MRTVFKALAIVLSMLCVPAWGAVAKIVDRGQTWTATSTGPVHLCYADFSLCGPTVTIAQGAYVNCGVQVKADPAMPWPVAAIAQACYPDVPAAPASAVPQAFQACYPPVTVSWPLLTLEGAWYVDVPVSVESVADRFYKFRDCSTHLINGQFSTPDERKAMLIAWAMGQLENSAAANAWAKTQPVRVLTAKEIAWRNAELAASNAPSPPPPPRAVVAAGAVDRPVYKLNSSGNLGSSVIGIRVKNPTPCNPDKHAADKQTYMSVQNQFDTIGRPIAGDYYAACTLL